MLKVSFLTYFQNREVYVLATKTNATSSGKQTNSRKTKTVKKTTRQKTTKSRNIKKYFQSLQIVEIAGLPNVYMEIFKHG